MKCLSAFRDPRGKGWLNCDKRTHFAASTLRPGWAYELRYCPECYERVLGLPCPPKVNRGDLPHFQPLDIPKPRNDDELHAQAMRGLGPASGLALVDEILG